MSKYMEVSKAIELCEAFYFTTETCSVKLLYDSAPSIDIVRCKECKWCLVEEGGCERIGMVLFADEIENHFCGYGERKESE